MIAQRPFLRRFAAVLAVFACLTPGFAPALAATANLNWADDTGLFIDGPSITLKAQAGSQADTVGYGVNDITVSLLVGQTFSLIYPGPNPGKLFNDGGLTNCHPVGSDNIVTFSGPKTVTFTPSATSTCATGGGGGGGGGGSGGGGGGGVYVPPPAPAPSDLSGTMWGVREVLDSVTSIDDDLSTVAAPAGSLACTPGSLIRGSLPAVYYCARNGKRYVFGNEPVYHSWYADFSGVIWVSDATLASLQIGGNVTYRPGKRMIKIMSDPTVYVVSKGGALRAVPDEASAARLYGSAWNRMIDDVPDGFFFSYRVVAPLTAAYIIDSSADTLAVVGATAVIAPPAPPAPPAPVTPPPVCKAGIVFTSFMQIGTVSEEVRELQKLMVCLGLFDEPTTGRFADRTEAAVKAFQTAHGIEATGYVGPATRAALNSYR